MKCLPPLAIAVLGLNVYSYTILQSQQLDTLGSDRDLFMHRRRDEKITLESLSDLDQELIHSIPNVTLEEASKGKELLLELLRDAGVKEIDTKVIQLLPTLQHVEELYGKGPILEGLAQCESFRSQGKSLGIAGMFDSGTNLAANFLHNNCIMPLEIYWQVPWGKHVLAERRLDHDVFKLKKKEYVDPSTVLPVVLIRDPYFWMQSLCRHNYGAQWLHTNEHCPNLVPNEVDYKTFNFPKGTIPVRIKYDFAVRKWDSLAHLWTDWYRQYYQDADYPRLFVRYEDLVFYPKQVTQQICECAGGTLLAQEDFIYEVESAKFGPGHGEARTSWVSAMIRYGSARKRLEGLTTEDLRLARNVLDMELMQAFSYQQPPTDGRR
jgi:hypothetical protein